MRGDSEKDNYTERLKTYGAVMCLCFIFRPDMEEREKES